MLATATTVPSVYVASLSDYNAGDLHGCWINLDSSASEDEIQMRINVMLRESPSLYRGDGAEEWAVHDSSGVSVSECCTVQTLAEIAAAYEEIESEGHDWDVYREWLRLSDLDGFEHVSEFCDAYCGAYDEPEDYAHDLVSDAYSRELEGLPSFIRYHIDYAGIWRDLELGGDNFAIRVGSKSHVFHNH
jgi:antirestriction protein